MHFAKMFSIPLITEDTETNEVIENTKTGDTVSIKEVTEINQLIENTDRR